MFHRTLMSVLLCVSLTALGAGEVNQYGGMIVPPIDWSSYKPAKTGDLKDELKNPTTPAKEFITRYHLYVPDKLPEQKHLALLICFHGKGGDENYPAGNMHNALKRAGLDQNYIVLGLKARNAGWEDVDEIDVMRAYDWVTALYPIDRRRVYLVGHSSGAYWDTRFGSKHMDLIAGVMRWAGGSVQPPINGKDGPLMTEWYLVHGTKDDQNSVNGSRQGRDNLKQANVRYVYREILDGDHNNIVGMQNITSDMVLWMDALRHKTMPLAAEDEKFLKQFANGKTAAKLFGEAETWNELLRIGGPQAGVVLAEAMKSDKPKVREFAAIACTKGRFAGEDTMSDLAKLLDDKTAAVRSAAINALGVQANWRSDIAQMALGKLALNSKSKKVELQDRGDATVVLAKAATLPLLGNYDDDMPLWQALLGIMNDDKQEMRAAAFAPLKVAVPDGNGYDPTLGASDRTAPLAKWEAWFQTHMVSALNKQAKK
jgi:predicted esterase